MTNQQHLTNQASLPKHQRLLLTLAAIALLLGLLGGTLLYLDRPATAAPLPPSWDESAKPLTPPAQITAQQAITARDIVIVFDVSGSMEYGTGCYDCWVRTDSNNPDWPNNGYFNPLPYNTAWNGAEPSPQSSIPLSDLCVQPSTAHVNSGNRYLVHEAELYSRNVGDWRLSARTQGQGFWVLQRGTQNQNNINNPYENGAYKGNQAGNEAVQSSNVCNPSIQGNGINCSPRTDGSTPDNVCSSADGGQAADCSAYIKAHPWLVYTEGSFGKLFGAAYDITCFSNASDPRCWKLATLDDPTRPTQDQVPYVEYDFTPDWSGTVNIWIRARGGQDDYAREWRGLSPTSAAPQHYDTVMWQVGSGTVQENTSASESGTPQLDTRIFPGNWQWIKLGSVSGVSGVQQLLRIYQGSAGYKIDKIVFTNASDSNASSYLSSANSGKGPGATNGSATREACNVCNPEFGLTVDAPDCSCKVNSSDATRGGYGAGEGCTTVLTVTNQLENDLYRDPEPLRSAQEAVKHFARQLDPQVDQLGLVAFSTNVESGNDAYERRAKLQCLRYALWHGGECFDGPNPITFTNVMEAVERQWAYGGTDIAEGLREGLKELGVEPYAIDSNCGDTSASACDRGGLAHKVLVLITDGTPNQYPGSCSPSSGRPDLWNGDVSPNDDAFECAVHFGKGAADGNVTIFTIGLGPGPDPDLLTAIATGRDPHSYSGAGEEFLFYACNGQYFAAAKATDLDDILKNIATKSITPCNNQAVNQVTINGSTTGLTDLEYTFRADVEPSSAWYPITYTWLVDGELRSVLTGGTISDTVSFTWDTPGQKTITVTAENALGSASDSHTITLTVETVPASDLNLSGPTTGDVATSYSFTATVSPVNATQPFTYVWQATDKAPVSRTGGAGSDSVSFTWDTPGPKTIIVSADNGTGPVSDSQTIVISAAGVPERMLYLPLILK